MYDRECGFCTWVVDVLLRWDRADRLRPVALQDPEAARLLPHLTPDERLEAFHLVPDGRAPLTGGEALPPLLRLLPGGALPAAGLDRIPGVTDRGYRWVAAHRVGVSRLVPGRLKARARERVG
jgi:predicted DCC family thiol-disulfide oxidoreductase YuxK